MAPFEPLVLEGTRVKLRFVRETDAGALFDWYSDPVVARYLSFPVWTEASQAAKKISAMLKGYETGEHLNLVVERSSDAAPMGTAGLFHIHETNWRAELGYTLGRAFWGQGLMHDALLALVDHAFCAMNLNRLEADIDPRNAASARSLDRLGFRHEGVMRERWIVNGEVSDTGFYGLLRSEWCGVKSVKND